MSGFTGLTCPNIIYAWKSLFCVHLYLVGTQCNMPEVIATSVCGWKCQIGQTGLLIGTSTNQVNPANAMNPKQHIFPNKHLSWAVGGWRMLIGSCYQWGNSKRLQSRTVFQPSKEWDILSGRWFPELQLICGTSGRTSAIRIRASSFSFVCQGFRLLTLYLNLIRGKGGKHVLSIEYPGVAGMLGEREELERGMTYHPGLKGTHQPFHAH